MAMDARDGHPKLSRRDFLRSASLIAAGATAASMIGCAPKDGDGGESTPTPSPSPDPVRQADPEIEVIDTDLLLVGFGNAGIAATWQALKDGHKVTVVDKGPFRHAGPTGWAWGCYSFVYNAPMLDYAIMPNMLNQKAWQNILNHWNATYNPAEIDNPTYQVNHGQTLVARLPNGSVDMLGMAFGLYMEQYFRRELDELSRKSNVTVYDNTMLTDVLVNDGVCYGAMGIHLPTGRFRVFRANATIMATGAPVWMFGWKNTKPVSLGGSDNTGDLEAACYRRGLAIGENEAATFDLINPYPRAAFTSALGVDGTLAGELTDKDGNPVFPNGMDETKRWPLNEGIAQCMIEGRDPIYVDAATFNAESSYLVADCFRLHKEYLNRDILAIGKVPIEAEMFEKGGTPVIDENLMTEIKGLFCARGAGVNECNGFNNPNSQNLRMAGCFAGHTASEWIDSHKQDVPELDWQPVLDEYARLHELRTRTVEGGIRPLEIREKIQQATYESAGLVREKSKMEAAIAEFERIRNEDVPRMCCADQTMNGNTEWRFAIETLNLLDCAEMTVRASLFREESTRWMYVRPDFPTIDDENWACLVVCRNVDGKMTVEKQALPTL